MRIQAIVMLTLLTLTHVAAQETTIKSTDMEALELTRKWDKTFPQSDRVEHSKVTFHNRYGITLAADLYKPKNGREPLTAVAVSGPYGAVKEQVSGRYAQTLAEQGFLTVAILPIMAKAAVRRVISHRPKSVRRISARRSTISRPVRTSIRNVSES